MKAYPFAAIVALSIAADVALAEAYQLEAGAVHLNADEARLYGLTVQWYLSQIQTESRPLAEAAFLQRESNLGVSWLRGDQGFLESAHAVFALNVYVPDTIFYVGAYLDRNETTQTWEGETYEESGSGWGATFGLTPIDGLLLTTVYADEVGYDLNLQLKYVLALAGETAVSFDAAYWDGEYTSRRTLGADYYFDQTWSLGAWTESSFDTGVGVRGRKFFTPTISAGASYFFDDNFDYWQVQLTGRF